MVGPEGRALGWLLHTAVGGGLLLLLAGVLMARTRPIARRQRLGEWGVAAALLLAALSLGPAWLPVTWPAPVLASVRDASPAVPEKKLPLYSVPAETDLFPAEPALAGPAEEQPGFLPAPPQAVPPVEQRDAAQGRREPAVAPPEPGAGEELDRGTTVRVLLGLYAGGAGLFVGRWLLGHLALWRLLRQAEAAPRRVTELAQEMSGRRRPRVLVSGRVRVPFSCGLLWPTVVLPRGLAETAPGPVLRWVLAHELTHLERRDAWAGCLLDLGQGVYFYLPWFWWLRRQVRLCQEYVADAAAAGGRPEDYAQFLRPQQGLLLPSPAV